LLAHWSFIECLKSLAYESAAALSPQGLILRDEYSTELCLREDPSRDDFTLIAASGLLEIERWRTFPHFLDYNHALLL